jgi:phosphopantothenoylcysteine synthetase/decarboxylase
MTGLSRVIAVRPEIELDGFRQICKRHRRESEVLIEGDDVVVTAQIHRASAAVHRRIHEPSTYPFSAVLGGNDDVFNDHRLRRDLDEPDRLAAPERIVEAIEATLVSESGRSEDLAGLHILVTAGGTREPIDPVRFIGNRSSGKQGYACAEEAVERGAKVTLVTTSALSDPAGVEVEASDLGGVVQRDHRDSQLDAALVLVRFLLALPVGAVIGG